MNRLLALISVTVFAGLSPSRKSVSTQHVTAPRILLIYDMEGISCVDKLGMVLYGEPDYGRGQECLIGDVNAVVDGLFAAGVSEVAVWDNHGSGIPGGQNIPPQRLDARARLLDRNKQWATQGQWDAVALVGMHAAAGMGGFLSHTGQFGSGEMLMNGTLISESDLHAWSAATDANIPIILASGDDVLHRHIGSVMPWVEYVEVKRAVSPALAQPYSSEQVRTALRAGVARAIARISEARVRKPPSPATFVYRATPPMNLRPLLTAIHGGLEGGIILGNSQTARLSDYGGTLKMDEDSVVSFTVVRDSVSQALESMARVRVLAGILGKDQIRVRVERQLGVDSLQVRLERETWLNYESRHRSKP
jgi:D-amino peptidase